MLQIALGAILFVKKTQFATDECCAGLCPSLSPVPLPSQILLGGSDPRSQAQPMKDGTLNLILQSAQGKVQKSESREASAWETELAGATSARAGTPPTPC